MCTSQSDISAWTWSRLLGQEKQTCHFWPWWGPLWGNSTVQATAPTSLKLHTHSKMFPRTASNTYRHYNTLHSQIGKVNALPSLFMCNRRGQPACDADFMLQGHTVPQIPTTSDMFWQDICNIKWQATLQALQSPLSICISMSFIFWRYKKRNQTTPVMQNAACIVLSLAFTACHI